MNFYVLATIAGLTLLAALSRIFPLSLRMYGFAVFLLPTLFLNSVRAQSDYHLQIVKPTVGGLFSQRFLCAKPYSIAECNEQVVILQVALRRYPIERLGQWTWVIVRSEDWKSILTRVQMDPDSPAFSILERHQTFFEEALLVSKPERQLELLKKWHIPFDKFLDFAVSHELGHAFCGESDEIKAERSGQRLRKGEGPLCGKLGPSATITVQMYNYSRASPTVLTGAEREAGRILGEAGVQPVWLECPVEPSSVGPEGPCKKAPEATGIRLRVLAAPTEIKVRDTIFGFTVHPVLASVYYEHAARRAKSDDAEFELPIILGCAIAHELGHLLLGPDSHSDWGIMQGKWEPNQFRQLTMGTFLFTAEQSRLMRAQAQMRTRAQAENGDIAVALSSDTKVHQ